MSVIDGQALQVWAVYFSRPFDGDTSKPHDTRRSSRWNMCIAPSIEEAIAMIHRRHPRAIIHSANHRGGSVLLPDTQP